jgi:hypothetical protein
VARPLKHQYQERIYKNCDVIRIESFALAAEMGSRVVIAQSDPFQVMENLLNMLKTCVALDIRLEKLEDLVSTVKIIMNMASGDYEVITKANLI